MFWHSKGFRVQLVVAIIVALSLPIISTATRRAWVNTGPEQIYARDLVESPSDPAPDTPSRITGT